jgi:rRNA maturation protein Nop10
MNRDVVDLDALPLRFSVPDGWKTPDPLFVSLYQGSDFPSDWQPYEGAPYIPPSWPWWEENGTSWYRFFRDRAPMPARALGNWFSLAALGLFSVVVSPFALSGWLIAAGGFAGVTLLILGIRGVIRTTKRHSAPPDDPYEAVRIWAQKRREAFFQDAYQRYRQTHSRELTMSEFVRDTVASWWGENPSTEEN